MFLDDVDIWCYKEPLGDKSPRGSCFGTQLVICLVEHEKSHVFQLALKLFARFYVCHNSIMGQVGNSNNYRRDLQALRGVAILLVLFFHLPGANLTQGFLGVDIFFVISGFLITPRIIALFSGTPSLGTVKNNFLRFASNRISRLAPAFAVTILIFLPLLLLFGDINLRQVVINQVIAGFLLLGNVGAYKFGGDYFHPGISNPLLHIWSLAVEEQIYIVLPIFLLLLYIIGRKHFKLISKATIIGLTLISLFLTLFSAPLVDLYGKFFAVPTNFVFYSPITRFWEFGVGGVISLFYASQERSWGDRKGSNLYNLLFLAFLLTPTEMSSNLKLLLVITFTGVLVVTRSLEAVPNQIHRLLTYFGDRSYSIYLVHLPIFYLTMSSPLVLRYLPELSLISTLLAMMITVSLGSWMFGHVELKHHRIRPARSTSQVSSPRKKSLLLLIGSSLTLALAFFPVINSGYFGVLEKSSNNNPGVEFKDYCVREEVLRQFPCSFPNNGASKTVMLLGDSHATQYSILLWDLLRSRDYNLVLSGDFGGAVDSSRTIDDVRRFRPDLTIVSKYWRADQFVKDSELSQALDEIKRLSGRMIVVGQNPVFAEGKSDPGKTLLEVLLGDSPETVISLKSQLPLPESRNADGLLKKWALQSEVQYLDSFGVLCPRIICEREVQGRPLYIDSNHLSVFGAEMLRTQFSDLIDESEAS